MKAVIYKQYGTPDVLEIKEIDKPKPKDNEVLVKVRAASVNSWDWDLVRGKPRIFRLTFGIVKPRYQIIGSDIAGRVEAIAKNVKDLKPGDDVFGDISAIGFGAFAEYVCVPEHLLAIKSEKMTYEEAAAIPQAGVLAVQGLQRMGEIRSGQKILINGAGGGVGTFALQLAKLKNPEITCVDNSEKMDMLSSMGADFVMDYSKDDFTRQEKKYDMILDAVALRSVSDYLRALSKNGKFVFIGGSVRLMIQCLVSGPFMRSKKLIILPHKPNRTDLDYLKSLFDEGKIKPVIDKIYPITKIVEAIRYLGEGKAKGKLVIQIGN